MRKREREYLYFIQCGERGPIKIGIAVDLKKRLSMLQVGNPHRLNLVLAFEIRPGDAGARDVETMLHRQLRPYRVRGEWFAAETARDIAEFLADYMTKTELAAVIRPAA